MRDVLLIMRKHGSFWSACVWLRSGTDARVNTVVPKLYEKFPDIDALAEASVEEIEEIVKPCGLGRSKARDISGCMKMLRDEFHSRVPDDFDALLRLPGVGRKSANLIMGDVFGSRRLLQILTASVWSIGWGW